MRLVLAGAIATAALAPASAFAVDYLSVEQAARLMFPDADHFDEQHVALDAAAIRSIGGQGIGSPKAVWPVQVARRGGQALGYVVRDEVIGKFERISFAVGFGLDGAIRQVEVLSYRESHGGEVRLPAWRRQFVGKTSASALRVGDDIANISGATLSCTHLTDGVRRITAMVAFAKTARLLE